MTTLTFNSTEEQETLHKLVCKCGHTLIMHAFTMHYNEMFKHHEYWASQCVSCECKTFQKGKDD